MRLSLKQLKHLSVETQSGIALGRVFDLVFEIDGQLIAQYLVKSSRLSMTVYTVSRDQIVSITAEKMIVENRVKAEEEKQMPARIAVQPEVVAMRTPE